MSTQPAPTQYRLQVNISIVEVDPSGYTSSSSRLEVRDSQDLGPMDFLQIAGVLGKFHDLKAQIAAPVVEPEPEEATEIPNDAPFGPIRSFRIPPLSTFAVTLPIPPELSAPIPRWAKQRRKYVEALAASCGCNDVEAHNSEVKP